MADRGTAGNFAISELTGWAALQLDCRPAALPSLDAPLRAASGISLPLGVGEVTGEADLRAMRVAPGRLRLVADSRAIPASILAALEGQVTIIEITHGQRRYRLSGARLFEVLAKGIALDFASAAVGPGRCALTQLHRVPVLLHRLGERMLELYVPRSFAQSIEEWLTDAALAYGAVMQARGEPVR